MSCWNRVQRKKKNANNVAESVGIEDGFTQLLAFLPCCKMASSQVSWLNSLVSLMNYSVPLALGKSS
jgi:hypothetical protein